MKITLRNITKKFDDITALENVSVDIEDGHFFFFLGPSGCGKTTMLRIISGFETPDSGSVFFNDTDITGQEPNKRNTGMVFQNYALWPHLTVYKNVEYGLKIRGVEKGERQERVFTELKNMNMEAYSNRYPGQLSGGQKQRIALARALVVEPDILLLDEPLSNLDTKLKHEMTDEIKRIHDKKGITT
ncbi:MAG: ABC transporter ATP-binding protein, partial [Oligoflexia bacterium]|nr:ABC transporter ATP-binding protein [Oligoflexia bacterium]